MVSGDEGTVWPVAGGLKSHYTQKRVACKAMACHLVIEHTLPSNSHHSAEDADERGGKTATTQQEQEKMYKERQEKKNTAATSGG